MNLSPSHPAVTPAHAEEGARYDYTICSRRGLFIGTVRASSSLDALHALYVHAEQERGQFAPCDTGQVLRVDPICLIFYVVLRPGAEPIYYELKDFQIERA